MRPVAWLAGLGGCLGTYLVVAAVTAFVRRRMQDKSALRRRAAAPRARQQLRDAEAKWQARQVREAADRVQDSLAGLVADVADLPDAGLTAKDVLRQLRAWSVDESLVARTGHLLEACDAARYGGAAASGGLCEEAEQVLEAVIAALRKSKEVAMRESTRRLVDVAAIELAAALPSPVLAGCGRRLDLDSARMFQQAEQTFAQAKSPDDYLKAAAMDQEILDRGYRLRRGALQPGERLHASGPAGPGDRRLPPGTALPGPRSVPGGQPRLCPGETSRPPQRRTLIEHMLFWQDWISYPAKFQLAACGVGVSLLLAVAALVHQTAAADAGDARGTVPHRGAHRFRRL